MIANSTVERLEEAQQQCGRYVKRNVSTYRNESTLNQQGATEEPFLESTQDEIQKES
jgi:hypothetical protein